MACGYKTYYHHFVIYRNIGLKILIVLVDTSLLEDYHYIRVNSIKDDEYYYCISAFYKDDAKYMIIEDEYVKYLDELGDAEEITEQEFINFINSNINKIIK